MLARCRDAAGYFVISGAIHTAKSLSRLDKRSNFIAINIRNFGIGIDRPSKAFKT